MVSGHVLRLPAPVLSAGNRPSERRQSQRTTMNYPFSNPHLEPYERFPAFVEAGLPQEVRDAIATLRQARNEAADQIERLLAFLDETEFGIEESDIDKMLAERFGDGLVDEDFEPDADLEPDVDDEHSGDEFEPSLGSSDSMHQAVWGQGDSSDFEVDDSDYEPSLCGVGVERGDDRDLEADGCRP
ncbi:hypothetical protein OZ411_01500 [Bradyrhizobium sp. Arg237L]|uniref:hypothetical protein n=1 Tax=Bradyrhizobium sp. Arg237L TaxID=3003352 RepID=UPI00249E6AE8|nr:hypothetical protein [Bradyrhizobium sp. Arg237L]MDI4231488.1 hypothetical protein [Bradyrhizobium sp. Arg237L]